MKKYYSFILLFAILILTSCKTEEHQILKIEQDIVMYSQIDTIYDHDICHRALNLNSNIFDFCKALDINQYKSAYNLNYTVLETTKGLFWVLFDNNGTHATMLEISFSPTSNEDNISGLKVGMTLENTRAADPDGQYPFLWHSSKNYPRISYHYFENGDCFIIKYEEDVIVEIVCFTL